MSSVGEFYFARNTISLSEDFIYRMRSSTDLKYFLTTGPMTELCIINPPFKVGLINQNRVRVRPK